MGAWAAKLCGVSPMNKSKILEALVISLLSLPLMSCNTDVDFSVTANVDVKVVHVIDGQGSNVLESNPIDQ